MVSVSLQPRKGKTTYINFSVVKNGWFTSAKWVGYIVHARCWELLSYHELGSIAESNLAQLLAALEHRRMMVSNQCKVWRNGMYREGKIPNQNWCACSCELLTKYLWIPDPVRTRCVEDVINLPCTRASQLGKTKERTQSTSSPKGDAAHGHHASDGVDIHDTWLFTLSNGCQC